MSKDTIRFSCNWNNKLHCRAFSTIRMANANYYRVGGLYWIECGKMLYGTARCVAIHTFPLGKLTEAAARLDTGYSAAETRQIIEKMYKEKATPEALFMLVIMHYDTFTEAHPLFKKL